MDKEYIVYTRTNCPVGDLVKELLDAHKLEYLFFDINIHKVDADFFKKGGHEDTPQIYLDGELIGGYDELYAHLYVNYEKEDGEMF